MAVTPKLLVIVLGVLIFILLSNMKVHSAEAIISGPTKVVPGQFIVLNAMDSIGDRFHWIMPSNLKDQGANCGTSFFTSIMIPGVYDFDYVAVDAESINHATHTIVVSGTSPTNPDNPDLPDNPDPPTNNFIEVEKASRSGQVTLGDQITTVRLVEALAKIKDTGDLSETRYLVLSEIEKVLLSRGRQQRGYDWKTLWRIPVNKEIDQYKITTSKDYMSVISSVITGLSSKPVVLAFVSNSPCVPCDQWKDQVLPKLLSSGVIVQIFTSSHREKYPIFLVAGVGGVTSLEGYQTLENLTSEITSLSRN